jgi:hypothetical protein
VPLHIVTLNNLFVERLFSADANARVFGRGFHADMPVNNVKQRRVKGYIPSAPLYYVGIASPWYHFSVARNPGAL